MDMKTLVTSFASLSFKEAAITLFNNLGYYSSRNKPESNQLALLEHEKVNKSHFFFQLTDEEIKSQNPIFQSPDKPVDNSIMHAYFFVGLELKEDNYSRTDLSKILRTINKRFLIPVLVLFKYGNYLTLGVIHRRLNKNNEDKDVLEKVTLIKDISIQKPHRAHLEILNDLTLSNLTPSPHNFVELHQRWQRVLDTKELNKKFYKELSQWYFWAIKQVNFPNPENIESNQYHAQNLIRLLTRLLFVWFVKEKQLIPDQLFEEKYLSTLLESDDHSRYYKAILQNLFFATLNQIRGQRQFRKDKQHMNITNLMRYERYFNKPEEFLTLVESIVPFMNGGLFECLDKPHSDKKGKQGGDVIVYYDGFSDREDNVLKVPDFIFFGEHKNIDLSSELGTKHKSVQIRGLIDIFKQYKFTVTENTPIEEDVALDPELLGQVFENLLATYNPETGTTARKQTGSFYTPREIVDYMVDESLIAYLNSNLQGFENLASLRKLLNYSTVENPFNREETLQLINAIDHCKVLDPACGSGAFPMGVLHKLVHCLHILDPQNKQWKERQLEKAHLIDDDKIREQLINDIEEAFNNNELDYGRKLYLIENGIYGIDIQSIAIQISKLRFFISLMVDQQIAQHKENFGVRPLPNLETKFVAANTLIGIEKPKAQSSLLSNKDIEQLEQKLKNIRHRIFSAKTPKKKRDLREQDKILREQIGELLEKHGLEHQTAVQLAQWNPYDQNMSSPFFDPEWMFGLSNGFDIVIGNPPYINVKSQSLNMKQNFKVNFKYSQGADVYVAFIEKSISLLKNIGRLIFIIPNKFFGADYGKAIRAYMRNSNISISSIWDLKDEKVFESAAISTVVILINNYASENPTKIIRNGCENKLYDIFDENGKIQIEANQNDNAILNLMKQHKSLSEYADIRTGIMGFEYWKMKNIINSKNRENSIPIYTNGNFTRYKDSWAENKIKLYKDEYEHPVIELNESFLNKNTIALFKQHPKIIVRGVSKEVAAIIDNVGSGLLVAVHSIIPHALNINYILALLNSKLLNWFHLNTVYSLRIPQGSLKYPVSFFEQLPIPKIPESEQQPFIELVNKILLDKKAGRDTKELEEKIDQLVYKLYELTEEEIKIVEGK